MLPYHPDWNRTSTSTGYKVVYCPDHPRAWSTGYVYVHVVVMEQKLGRLLCKGETVHHKDENRHNNDPDNLELTDRKKHGRIHKRPQEMVPLVCGWCGETFDRRKGQDPDAKGYAQAYCSRSCNGKANGFKSL